MRFVTPVIRPADMETDELVRQRARIRLAIMILEIDARTVDEDLELREMRAYQRELMREAGKRFIQERLF